MSDRRWLIIIGLGVLLLVEIVVVRSWYVRKKRFLSADLYRTMAKVRLVHERDMEQMEREHLAAMYRASGETAVARSYNRQDQSIVEMTDNVAAEVFPDNWRCRVKVEEFTNFLLTIQVDTDKGAFPVDQLLKRLPLVVRSASPYLKSVALFDRRHQCFLFLDQQALMALHRAGSLSKRAMARCRRQGEEFQRFNSKGIPFVSVGGHHYVDVDVSGATGIATVRMMLDTGASTSVISRETWEKTGGEDLNRVKSAVFSTASGRVRYPIVRRSLRVGQFARELEVAVSVPILRYRTPLGREDPISLLGVDFFAGVDYLIDTANQRVYVWER